MRRVRRTALVLLLLTAAGCSGECDSEGGGTPKGATPPAAAAEGGTAGITLDLPKAWTAWPQGDRTDFWAGAGKHFSLWVTPVGTTEEDALAAVASTIAPAVKDFEVTSEERAEVAGVPAQHVFGTGLEADDGDDSLAEVYVFTLGGRVRVLCVHGEGRAAEILRPDALAILASAKPN